MAIHSAFDEQQIEALRELRAYPLIDAIVHRRSRRFSVGATMPGGGLAYRSQRPPQPLSPSEEAVLVVAAAGMTGFCLGDIPYSSGPLHEAGGGNVIASLAGRTGASADAVHSTALFVINDEATYMIRRPQDLAYPEIDALRRLAAEGRYVELYERTRVRVRDGRTSVPREVPAVFPFNKWDTNLPGTTYFLPVCDLTGMYINVLLSCFDEEMGMFLVDERDSFNPAGIGRFGASQGGTLHDDPQGGRVAPILALETIIVEFMLAEQAFMVHNLSLVEQAMGLGGWTHFATASDMSWFDALGFRRGSQRLSQVMHAGPIKRLLLKALKRDQAIPFALGLTVDGRDLIEPFCPPHYRSMEEAVHAFLDLKIASVSTAQLDAAYPATWKDPRAIQATIPRFSPACIAATIEYCTYVYETYGRFPAYFGPMRTTLAHQAHHLDLDFYDRFYQAGAYTETQAAHQRRWHGGPAAAEGAGPAATSAPGQPDRR